MVVGDSKLLSFAGYCLERIKLALLEYSSKYSRRDFTQHQLAVLLCLMRKYRPKYRDFVELIVPMDSLADFLGLGKTPHFTTLNKFFLRMKNLILSQLLELTSCNASGNASIDSTGFDRRHASKHYVKRAKMKLKALKTTLLVDTAEQQILGMHNTTTKRHDSKIIMPLISKGNENRRIISLAADAGYDDSKVRLELRKLGIRPLIRHREFTGRQKLWNKMMKKKDCNQRWKSETVNSALKRKYGDYVASRRWFTQFNEMKLVVFAYNIDREMMEFIIGFLQSTK